MEKDMTVEAAARWVAQEFAKVNGSNWQQRLAHERQLLALGKKLAHLMPALPVSEEAHKTLVEWIEESYEKHSPKLRTRRQAAAEKAADEIIKKGVR